MSTITCLGHATALVVSEHGSFITDPIFSDRIFWIKRLKPLPFPAWELPEVSFILISHAHLDHLDFPSFKYIPSRIPVILPKGIGKLASKFLKNPLIELHHGNTHELKDGVSITAFPVNHRGFRISGLTYRVCNGYLVRLGGKRIFFTGDTGYRSDFKHRVGQVGGIDLALLPIGPCRPAWFMRPRHLNPADALRVADEIEAEVTVPIHWGTFRLGMEPADDPIHELRRLIERENRRKINILNPGESLTF